MHFLCVGVSLVTFVIVVLYLCRTGLVFISIGNNKVSDSVDDMHSLSMTAVYDSINFINRTFIVSIYPCTHAHVFAMYVSSMLIGRGGGHSAL